MLFKEVFARVCTPHVSTDKRVPAFPPLHMTELWVACVTPSLGVFGVLPSLTVASCRFTLALGGYVPVLTRPQRAEWSRR